ncbi:dual specificity protein phosphatase Mpk3 isoform X2 [Teleopsis dalmanni]|uniref:dual specificity protein phosphatase Mpk3 isoform X2 n=1 Tax=Teleopsis dalmanni TaxID=139649 RepID=UPI0018CF8F1A|nr:dual specificity protein phosphatase Mpk3 isoform X2 [Teleopsis dalmanni]
MPETEYEYVTKEWLQSELRATSSSSTSNAKDLIILDCRSSHEYSESHIRSAVNFSIPTIMLRRLAAGKIDLLSTIKSPELKERIQSAYKISLFILYNNVGVQQQQQHAADVVASGLPVGLGAPLDISGGGGGGNCGNGSGAAIDTTINVLHKRLKQDGCRVVSLQDGFSSFRQAFPEWCEDISSQNTEMESSRSTQADQLMGLRSLRISTPHSDSACSSSAESSDCESTTHHNFNEAPVEIIPGLFLGNASHSNDSGALQKYNIKYVLNVTPDLPNVFEESGGIQYLQIPITDHYSQDLAMHFPTAIKFIEEARSKNSAVLVHCLAGVSRSVTVTLAYLMHTRSLNLNDAFTLVRDRKPDVSPNFHFMQQLHSFEQQLHLTSNECTAMDESVTSNTLSATVSAAMVQSNRCGRGSKFTCTCIATDCKCMQTGGYMAQLAKATGVSPDSGIEFDRWTPSSDTGLK